MLRLKEVWTKKRVPERVRSVLARLISRVCENRTDFDSPTDTPEIKQAINDQRRIGMDLMVRGFLARSWTTVMAACGKQTPSRQVSAILTSLWDVFYSAVWRERNRLLHKEENKYNAAEDQRLNEQIRWYVENRRRFFSCHDQFLAEYDVSTLHRRSRKVKRKWVQVLEKVRAQYEIECMNSAKKQRTIPQWLGLVSTCAEGVT